MVNVYIVYEINKNCDISSYPTLKNCQFGAFALTKNVHIDKYKYSGYGIRFDGFEGFFSEGNGVGANVIIFGTDMSLSPHIDDNKKYILILGKGPTQGLEQH